MVRVDQAAGARERRMMQIVNYTNVHARQKCQVLDNAQETTTTSVLRTNPLQQKLQLVASFGLKNSMHRIGYERVALRNFIANISLEPLFFFTCVFGTCQPLSCLAGAWPPLLRPHVGQVSGWEARVQNWKKKKKKPFGFDKSVILVGNDPFLGQSLSNFGIGARYSGGKLIWGGILASGASN